MVVELLILLGIGGLVWLAKRGDPGRSSSTASALPITAALPTTPALPTPALPTTAASALPTSEPPSLDPCMEWTNRASALAVKPDGSRITDGEARQLENLPLWIIPNAYERAATTWARGAGRPPDS